MAIDAHVMLTANVSDCLVNGAGGEVIHTVIKNSDVTTSLVKFDKSRVGLKSIHTSPH